jgi:hypothetical protein
MRVIGWKTCSRNEGDPLLGSTMRTLWCVAVQGGSDCIRGTTRSIPVGTRKMVNYA